MTRIEAAGSALCEAWEVEQPNQVSNVDRVFGLDQPAPGPDAGSGLRR